MVHREVLPATWSRELPSAPLGRVIGGQLMDLLLGPLHKIVLPAREGFVKNIVQHLVIDFFDQLIFDRSQVLIG